MKKFFSRASKSFANSVPAASATFVSSSPTAPHTTGLQPQYTVPPVPHPSPYAHIALLVAKDGLLLRPHLPGEKPPSTHVKLSWGKVVNVEEVDGDGSEDWSPSVVVYGLVGVLQLFTDSHLLVITSREDAGTFLEPTHTVYTVKGVMAIPLNEEKARITVNTLAARNTQLSRPSLLANAAINSTLSMDNLELPGLPDTSPSSPKPSIPRVQFAPLDESNANPPAPNATLTIDVPQFSGLRASSPSPSDVSVSSTPSTSETSPTSPIAKALASRLSFWSRLSKRNLLFPSTPQLDATPDKETAQSLLENHEALEAIMQDSGQEPTEVLESILAVTAPPPSTVEEKHSELEVKIIRECIREFTKGGMYFSYNFDITRSLQHKQEHMAKSRKQSDLLADLLSPDRASQEGDQANPLAEPYPTLPLWRRVDRQYWWNEWLSKPLLQAGLHSYVLPIMQGYYQVARFSVPDTENDDASLDVDYIILSRRSRDRAGLRYQRRGIDDEAHVANFVETETVMRIEREGIRNIFSYVQIRGSIPLFWTQSGYGLKPPPVLSQDRTHTQNLDAMRRHFERTVPKYGPHTIISLAEQSGKEGVITQGYKEYVAELNQPEIQYHAYDFHRETKGMKYENIAKLIAAVEKTFDQQGYLWISENIVMSRQKGVFRVNCIDCLDRTNVVQSAFARYIMNKQLGAVAVLNTPIEGRVESDSVFNDLWANNGDAISRAYAGTSALKGDFTRTGKRDLSGLLNDGVNSLARMYTSTFSDWFSQAVIDFMLGNRTLSVFSEFLLKLQSTDPRDLVRLSKIRAEAIATSVERVLTEGERLLGGWTLFSPGEFNVKVGDHFEEKVVLLTTRLLYIISYDYTLQKVKQYTRIPLGDIVGISKGAYILSPLEEASRDPVQNAGFIVTWVNSNQVTRVTSYSVRNSIESPRANTPSSSPRKPSFSPRNTPNKLADSDLGGARTSATLPIGDSRKANSRKSLSAILSNASMALENSETTFAAFKALPIDPARVRRGESLIGTHRRSLIGSISTITEVYGDDLTGAATCQEAVNIIVETIRKAVEDLGGGHISQLVIDSDIVGLAEAQRMTSMYAKMEYGVKRLLWLGG